MNKAFTKLGVIVVFVLSFLSASAYDFEVDGLYYTVTDLPNLKCEVVSGNSKYEGEVIIPSTVTFNFQTFTVVGIGSYAFHFCSSLTSVTISDSVTSIGDRAFYGCSSLMSVMIPISVTSIGEAAFSGCSSLTSVKIPDSVTSIGNWAFAGCSSLTSVTIPDSVTSIGEYAFYGCSSLTSVTIGNSLTSIGELVFYGCSSLTSITIGNSVTSIGEYALYCCSSLTRVTIPDSVTSIGEYAFNYCSELMSITFSKNLKQINFGTFGNSPKLESIEIPGSVKEIVQYVMYEHEKRDVSDDTFTNLKKLSLKYSEEYLSSSYYNYYDVRVYSSEWDSGITDKLEEVFFDRQMKYSMPLPNVKILSFGEHLKEVQVKEIQNCENLDTIVCYGTEPPTLPECSNNQYMNVVVKVPQEALEKYQQAENWKNFQNLQGFDPGQSGVDEIPATTVEKVETGRYNLNGQRVGEDYKGIVIVRYSDGSTRKLIYHK